MSTTQPDWIEEAKRRADAKHNAKQARFMAPDDEKPKDPDVILLNEGSTLEGVILDMSEIMTDFGPTIVATIDTSEYGVVKTLAGAKILADLFASAGIGDFVSMLWVGKKKTKDGTRSYRHFSVAHVPAPGSGREAHSSMPSNEPRLPFDGGGNADDDLDDDDGDDAF